MAFTDLFIRKPVLATVVSLFLLVLGLRAASELNVREYPLLENAIDHRERPPTPVPMRS